MERFRRNLRALLAVPKSELNAKLAEEKKARTQKATARKK
jgi:hypothetical protein